MNIIAEEPSFWFGDVGYKAKGSLGPRLQTHFQIVTVHRGEAIFKTEATRYRLQPGEATCMLPGQRYLIAFSRTGETRHTWCDCQNDAATSLLSSLETDMPYVVSATAHMDQLLSTGLSIDSRQNSSALRLLNAVGKAYLEAFFHAAGIDSNEREPLPLHISKALRWIHLHYADDAQSADIAQNTGISQQHLARLFRNHLGTTPIQYLWKHRLDEGLRMLRETGLTVADIAYRCGFKTPYHFSRLARQRTGKAPRQVRKEAWQAKA